MSVPARPVPDLTQPAHLVAPELVGCLLVSGDVVVRLVEVEAYEGADDPASHAWKGRSARNATMFGPPGHLYVYTMHGHACCNVVCGPDGIAQGVLLRAGVVVEGLQVARERRGGVHLTRGPGASSVVRDAWLARGPGNLTRALGITQADDGAYLLDGGPLSLLPGDGAVFVRSGPRVNVSRAWDRPWRFVDANSASVSAYKPHPAARQGLAP